MISRSVQRVLALHVAVVTLAFASVAPALAADDAVLRGRVTDLDGISPRSGIVVSLVDPTERNVYRSQPTNAEGAFEIHAAPANGYHLLAETDEGAFLAGADLSIGVGTNPPLALKLAPGQSVPNVTLAPGQAQAGGGTSWWQWGIAGAIVVVGLLVIADSSSDTEPAASRFAPQGR